MNKPELLAPAGTPSAALAALESGADAVYAGLSRFNARERGENFTPEAMAKVIEHFHRHGKKVYVTFNTLLKEQELPDAFEQLALLNSLRPDALLVQDLGVIRMAREYFPDLNLHSSTQMEFHNSAGLAVAEKLGVRFVDATDWDIDVTYDGVHYSEKGHQTFAEQLFLSLSRSLEVNT